ncbi:MAG: KTSC domain-containing protein, partial [Candidatus Moranbacteria bacterium CG17_big_fil_post_rev_8_21_14_2_50_44_12]
MVGILSVKFIKGGIYHYMDVPEELYQELLKAHSPGKFLAERIKNVYDYVKDQN